MLVKQIMCRENDHINKILKARFVQKYARFEVNPHEPTLTIQVCLTLKNTQSNITLRKYYQIILTFSKCDSTLNVFFLQVAFRNTCKCVLCKGVYTVYNILTLAVIKLNLNSLII